MKRDWLGLSRRYQAALRKHLKPSRRPSLLPAKGLGRQAMTIGLETLDLARMHEQALTALILPSYSAGAREEMIHRAGVFFAAAITPIEQTHRITEEINLHADRVNQSLRKRSMELADSNAQLRQEIAHRKSAEQALRESEQHYRLLLDRSRHMQEQLRLLSRQLLSAQEEERKKISRELHDVIAQTLTSINVQLTGLKNKTALNTTGLARSIARTQRLVIQSVDMVHRFARELRPTVLDDLGLIPALHTFMKRFTAETGIHVSLSAFAEVKHINIDQRTVLYRVAQEALTNIARHAQASRAEVKIQKLDGTVCMQIIDNGKGFQQDRVFQAKKGERLGLLGMSERTEMVGGKFSIASKPGKGTTVFAQIPLLDGKPIGRGRDRAPMASVETKARLL